VSEAAAISQPTTLDALAAKAWTLEPPMPHERKHLLRDEAAFLLDGLLVRLARGQGALDVAIGEGLAALGVGDRSLRLGYSSVGDYALDKLGIKASTAQKMARLAERLGERPLLREAVRLGEVSARKAETVVPVAIGDAEAAWVERAKTDTVRALKATVQSAAAGADERAGADGAVRATAAAQADPADERWERVWVGLEAEGRAKLDRAMALAGRILGAAAPKWKRLEAICEEYLGAHGVEEREGDDTVFRSECDEWLEAAKEALEKEMDRWSFLEKVELFPAPPCEVDGKGVLEIDSRLRELSEMRERWDEVFGHVAMLMRMTGLWKDMGFARFGHYTEERLGMAERTVGQRASLERRLWELPALRAAMKERQISYEKARLVARVARDDDSARPWIEQASRMPCIELAREIEEQTEKQACARGEMDLRVPERVADLLDSAFVAVRKAEGRFLSPSECLEKLAEHFIETWEPLLKERNTVQKRVLTRDRWLCQVPGCSRMATHVHHVVFKSAGGSDDPSNLVSLCALCRSRHKAHYADWRLMPRRGVEVLSLSQASVADAA
jgi:hypothetical protein